MLWVFLYSGFKQQNSIGNVTFPQSFQAFHEWIRMFSQRIVLLKLVLLYQQYRKTDLYPACIGDPATMWEPASIKTRLTCHTRVINFFYTTTVGSLLLLPLPLLQQLLLRCPVYIRNLAYVRDELLLETWLRLEVLR